MTVINVGLANNCNKLKLKGEINKKLREIKKN